MDFRPGKARNNSKLTGKYLAGRGRALKEFSRTSPRAEEVERRKHMQQLIISGQIMLDEDTFVKIVGTGKNGSTCDSVSSSSSPIHLEETDTDPSIDLTGETNCSKEPVGSMQWQREMQTESIFHNDLENHLDKLNIVDNSEDAASENSIPPRFRNSQWKKQSKKNKPWPNRPKKNDSERQFKEEVRGSRDQPRRQETYSPAMGTTSITQNEAASSDPWDEWEMSVVAQPHVIDDEDLEEIVAVDDNDTIDDVMVQQYINALHQEESGASNAKTSKLTPSRIQALSNLKSTTNADSHKVPPGTIPNPPKGPDRWGGSELKNIDSPTGWGDLEEETGNWYDDGSTVWSSPYGASGGWSWNS